MSFLGTSKSFPFFVPKGECGENDNQSTLTANLGGNRRVLVDKLRGVTRIKALLLVGFYREVLFYDIDYVVIYIEKFASQDSVTKKVLRC